MKTWHVMLIFIGIVLGIAGYGLWLMYGFHSWLDRGLFGDSFGALSSVFSGLALLGVVFAIKIQGEDLRLQRKEMNVESRLLALSVLVSANSAVMTDTDSAAGVEARRHNRMIIKLIEGILREIEEGGQKE